jgi:hypothetical protein
MGRPHMRSRATLIVAVLLCVTALVSCSKPLPGNLEVTDITTGRILQPDGTLLAESKTNSFWVTDAFYVTVTTEGTAENVTLQARWTGPDGKVVAEASKTISPSGTTTTALEAPVPKDGGRWVAGDHKVEILVNGSSQGTRDLVTKG